MKKDNILKSNKDDKPVNRIKQMISALIMSIVVWFIIINIVNPTISVWINDIPIKYSGESELREAGLVLVDRELPQISIKIRGTRRDLLKNMKKLKADFDLSSITTQGKSTLTPTILMPNALTLERQKNQSYSLSFEPAYEKEIPIVIKQTGDEKIKPKGKIVESTSEDEKIKIIGSKKETEGIESCLITIDVSDIDEDGKQMCKYSFTDKSLTNVSSSTIYYKNSTIAVYNRILERKSCPVEFEIPKELLLKYYITADEKYLSPNEIDIGVPNGAAAPEKLIARLKESDIILGNNEIEASIEAEDDIFLSQDKVKIKAQIERLLDQIIPVSVKIENIPEDLMISSNPTIEKFHVLIPESITDEVKATADASYATAGMLELEIKFDDNRIINIDNKKINIGFSKK